MRLAYLDFGVLSPVRPSAVRAVLEAIDLAERVEELGFARYWLGEHHSRGSAFASPEILVPVLAGRTTTLRIGVAAVLLQYRSPLKIATDFRMIEAMFPGRIDLGVGRGGADDERAHVALLDGRPASERGLMSLDAYERKCKLLSALLSDTLPSDDALAGVPVAPACDSAPEVWVCGAASAAKIAAEAGASFCLTLFHGRVPDGPGLMNAYRDAFVPSRAQARPNAALAVAGVCAKSADAAEAIRQEWKQVYAPTIVGDPETWRDEALRLRDAYGVEDLVVLDICQRYDDRVRHAELLASTLRGR